MPPLPNTYLVGGTVRDILLGVPPADYDLVTLDDPRQMAGRIAETVGSRVLELGKPGKMLFRVITTGLSLDITPANGASIEEDLQKRDFTVNALAACLSNGEVIDRCNGLLDINNKAIRMISPENLRADPIRLLRAYRLAACLGFSIDPATVRAIAADAHRITLSAGERVRGELMKLLAVSNSCRYLRLMDDGGLLTAIIPELAPLKTCAQNGYHQFDAFEHTLQAFGFLETLLHVPEKQVPAGHFLRHQPPSIRRRPLLKYAALLHDIGKPGTRTVDEAGRAHFYNHEKESADLAQGIHQRLRLSKRQQSYADFIIRHHLKPLSLFTLFQKTRLSQKAVNRFFLKCGHLSGDLLTHAVADAFGKGDPENAAAFAAFADTLHKAYAGSFLPIKNLPQLLSGDDLIREFGLSPSPLFAKILRGVEEERLLGVLRNRDEAIIWVKNYLFPNNPS